MILKSRAKETGSSTSLTSHPVPQAVNIVGGATGLIPSQLLEEKRKAFVRREWNGSGVLCGTLTGKKKKKKKMMYLMSKNAGEFSSH
uniref:Uncharacterized protein n=1 Tax=Hucho hucho TaxID=62062 RepID=A0A4W5LMC2_9TELE